MVPNLTNLIPPERIRAFGRLYFMRLATVGVLVLVGVVVIHAVLLVPSFLYARQQVSERTIELATLTATLAKTEEREVSARVTALSEDATYLARLKDAPTASALIRAILLVPRPGIIVTGFTFTPAAKGAMARMALSGVADTRDALRRYDQALSAEPYVDQTDLPISAYAKEREIAFTITLVGTLTP